MQHCLEDKDISGGLTRSVKFFSGIDFFREN